MSNLTRFRFTICMMASVSTVTASATAEACPFRDWLWGRSPYYQTRRYPGYPVTAGYTAAQLPAYSGVAQPLSSCDPCAQAYGGVATGLAAAPACPPLYPTAQPLTSMYAPKQYYRSSWLRVPVTRYRPVGMAQPWTGLPTTQLQACNSFGYQVQRVPTVRYRPLCSWLRGPQAMALPTYYRPPTASLGQCGSCSTTTTSGAATSSPYYVPNSGGYQTPGGQNGLVPAPAQAPGSGGSVAPADQPPRLPAEGSPTSAAYRGSANSSFPGPLSTKRPSPGPTATDIVPIPDPDSNRPSDRGRIHAPPLLDPQNHTAARARRPSSTTPVSWSEPLRQERRVVRPAAKPATSLGDGGWKSVRSGG